MLAPYDPTAVEADTVLDQDLAGRSFLFVTMPFGPFGRQFRDAIMARNARRVDRVIFNAGDALSWRRPGGVKFKGDLAHWKATFPEIARNYTDIFIFGESGPYNRVVSDHAARAGARLWVLENGYFRPDWITIERNGVNASSQLPRSADGYGEPVPEMPVSFHVGRILPYHVLNISLYHLVQGLGSVFYPRFRNPYTIPVWLQFLGHIQRYFRAAYRKISDFNVERLKAKGPFYIVCLQREGDNQLVRYSRFADNTAFLAEVLDSFAKHASKGARLVVKNHPLDPGLIDFDNVVRNLSAEKGLNGRVEFWDGGNLAEMCRASHGMVVNNSSAALSALGFGTPVKVLGQAFFDFEGLTDQKPLSHFWKKPQSADPELFKRFRAHVITKAQINGNFHEPRAIKRTARALATFLCRAQD